MAGQLRNTMRTQILVSFFLLVGCSRDVDAGACKATYARLEALECEQKMKDLLVRGCFALDLEPDDCDTSVLEPCGEEISKFAAGPDGWWAPLDTFLERKCGPEGTKEINWPEPDREAIAAANAAAEAEALAAAEAEAAAVEAAEREHKEAVERAAEHVRIKVTKIELQGALSKAQVSEIADAELSSLYKCLVAGLAKTPKLAGRVAINFIVTGSGKVGSSVVQSTDLGSNDRAVSSCMAKEIKTWTFPSPRGGGNVIITITFRLSSQ